MGCNVSTVQRIEPAGELLPDIVRFNTATYQQRAGNTLAAFQAYLETDEDRSNRALATNVFVWSSIHAAVLKAVRGLASANPITDGYIIDELDGTSFIRVFTVGSDSRSTEFHIVCANTQEAIGALVKSVLS